MSDRTKLLELDRSLMNGLKIDGLVSIYSDLFVPEKIRETIFNELKAYIAKRSSSNLTKNVSRLIDTNRVSFGVNSEVDKLGRPSKYGMVQSKQNKLFSLVVNVSYCLLPTVDINEFIKTHISELYRINKLQSDLRVVYDLEKIKELDRLKKRSSDAILNSIDYDLMIDVIYRLYILFLTRVTFVQSKQLRENIPELLLMNYQAMVVETLKRIGVKVDDETSKHLLLLSIYYSFFTKFSTLTHYQIYKALFKTFNGKIDNSLIEHFKAVNDKLIKTKETKGIHALAGSLTNCKLVKVDGLTFEELMSRMFGSSVINAFNESMLQLVTILITDKSITLPRGFENLPNDLVQKVLNAKKFVSLK